MRRKLIELESDLAIVKLQLRAVNLAADYQPELDRLAKRIEEIEEGK